MGDMDKINDVSDVIRQYGKEFDLLIENIEDVDLFQQLTRNFNGKWCNKHIFGKTLHVVCDRVDDNYQEDKIIITFDNYTITRYFPCKSEHSQNVYVDVKPNYSWGLYVPKQELEDLINEILNKFTSSSHDKEFIHTFVYQHVQYKRKEKKCRLQRYADAKCYVYKLVHPSSNKKADVFILRTVNKQVLVDSICMWYIETHGDEPYTELYPVMVLSYMYNLKFRLQWLRKKVNTSLKVISDTIFAKRQFIMCNDPDVPNNDTMIIAKVPSGSVIPVFVNDTMLGLADVQIYTSTCTLTNMFYHCLTLKPIAVPFNTTMTYFMGIKGISKHSFKRDFFTELSYFDLDKITTMIECGMLETEEVGNNDPRMVIRQAYKLGMLYEAGMNNNSYGICLKYNMVLYRDGLSEKSPVQRICTLNHSVQCCYEEPDEVKDKLQPFISSPKCKLYRYKHCVFVCEE